MHRGMEHGIRYSDRVHHIPGKFNILTDLLSRLDRPLKTEWALDQSIANSIFQMLNYPNVDFATCFNHTPIVCISSSGQSCLSDRRIVNGLELSSCTCIPTDNSDIPSVLAKILQSQCRIVLIAPLWPQRPWFSEVLQLLVSAPIRSFQNC